MTDIPEDIDQAAAECWGTLPKESAGIRHIALAILTERERCAQIALTLFKFGLPLGAGQVIASAIRNPTTRRAAQ